MHTLKRFHRFWRLRVDLGGPQDRPKSKKARSGHLKNTNTGKTEKTWKNRKTWKNGTLTKHCVYKQKLMFSYKYNKETYKIHAKMTYQKTWKIEVLGGFSEAKSHPKWWFFETWKTWKKHGRRSKSETWGCPKVDKKRDSNKRKNMKFQTHQNN